MELSEWKYFAHFDSRAVCVTQCCLWVVTHVLQICNPLDSKMVMKTQRKWKSRATPNLHFQSEILNDPLCSTMSVSPPHEYSKWFSTPLAMNNAEGKCHRPYLLSNAIPTKPFKIRCTHLGLLLYFHYFFAGEQLLWQT